MWVEKKRSAPFVFLGLDSHLWVQVGIKSEVNIKGKTLKSKGAGSGLGLDPLAGSPAVAVKRRSTLKAGSAQ
jgi:hypothetical protein